MLQRMMEHYYVVLTDVILQRAFANQDITVGDDVVVFDQGILVSA